MMKVMNKVFLGFWWGTERLNLSGIAGRSALLFFKIKNPFLWKMKRGGLYDCLSKQLGKSGKQIRFVLDSSLILRKEIDKI